MHPQEIKGH